jgi:hypothetical protein
VWSVDYGSRKGPFTFKEGTGPLGPTELRTSPDTDVVGRDPVALTNLNASLDDLPADARAFAKPDRFMVRLRFDGAEGDAVRKWALSADAPKGIVGVYPENSATILVINVAPIERAWSDGEWSDMPWEIRFNW